jgi:hypothetical protein
MIAAALEGLSGARILGLDEACDGDDVLQYEVAVVCREA